MKKVNSLKLVVLYLVIVFFLACASSREKKAFNDLAEVEETHYVMESEDSTTLSLPALNEESTVSDYLEYAALNNPGLEAAFNSWKAALEKVPQVRALPDPRFTYAYFVKEVETRAGPQRHKFGLAQMFPWFGKLDLKGNVALEAANAVRQQYEAAKLKLFFEVKDAYYEYYYLARAISVTEEHMQLVSYLESVARTEYRAGAAPYGAVIKAQVELGKLEDRLSTLRDFRSPVVARLNEALNMPFNRLLPWPKAIPEEKVVFSDEELLTWLKESNPDLKAIGFTVKKEKTAIDLAKKSYYPDITLGVEYINTNPALAMAPDPETGERPRVKDDGKDPVIAMVSINLPIWYGKYRAGEREARARYLTAVGNRSNRENSLIAGLKMVIYNFHDAERKIDLYRDSLIPKAEQALNVIQQAFAGGRTDFLDVVDAERTLLEFQLSFERALANRAQHLASIEKLIGRAVPRIESDAPVLKNEKPDEGKM
jgi:cobalt-zinc-cadmium efflux system outer membrane protein